MPNLKKVHPVAPARTLAILLTSVILAACSGPKTDEDGRDVVIDYGLLQTLPEEPISFRDEVQPILESRCIVCHGCWDAPCQLKLSSHEGITRGASKEKIYNAARLTAMPPTRLGIDASSDEEWRARGFTPVLNEDEQAQPAELLRGSVLYQMLRLKQLNPQPRTGRLPSTFDLALDREQFCTDMDGFDQFAAEHPQWGMPYAMPNLDDDEYGTLVQWIAQGAPGGPAAEPSAVAAEQIEKWETLLNGTSNKQQLVSRYLYEHLFLAHLHFSGAPNREFFKLVRSTTPPGQPVRQIPTDQPFNDPGPEFYYRLRLQDNSIVDKDHIVYEWSDERMARYQELFLDPEYEVDTLPTFDSGQASNPFVTFAPIPPNSRYRFLLDDARFFINGFIKGPVCRGQVALNVIEDHFWVFFFNPDAHPFTETPEFLDAAAAHLVTPSQSVSSLDLFAIFTRYSKSQQAYLEIKEKFIEQIEPRDLNDALTHIWDGNGDNRNASLTVFRHFDSATVEYGLKGDYPKTAWIIDYPLFERIHYLLVAGFDVFGNVGHQLNTRLYMDFLRMEGEDQFLVMMPPESRQAIREQWYTGMREGNAKRFQEPGGWIEQEIVTGFQTDDPQAELFSRLEDHLGALAVPENSLNRCPSTPCDDARFDAVDAAMARLATMEGERLIVFPDVALVRVIDDSAQGGRPFTLILNKGYKNLTSIFADEDNRDRDDDTLTVMRGVVGAYPNFFFEVTVDEVDRFVDDLMAVENRFDYEQIVARHGVRRTNMQFWATADWFQAKHHELQPIEAGILDLNRYRNR